MARVVIVYAIVALALIQGSAALEPALALPAWFDKVVIVLLGIGFPAALTFGWMLEIHPEGLKRAAPNESTPKESEAGGITADSARDAVLTRDPRSVAVLPLNNLAG